MLISLAKFSSKKRENNIAPKYLILTPFTQNSLCQFSGSSHGHSMHQKY